MGLGDVAGLGEHEGDSVLGRRQDVRLGGVDDHHPTARRCLEVDVVQPDSGPPDHDEVTARFQHLGGDLGSRADDEGGGTVDGGEELAGRERQLHVDFMAGVRHQLEPGGGELLGDKDPCHCQSRASANSSPRRLIPFRRSASDKA